MEDGEGKSQKDSKGMVVLLHLHQLVTYYCDHLISNNLLPILQRKLELENQLEEEKTKIELEKIKLEKKNAVLEIKIKQFGEQSKIL